MSKPMTYEVAFQKHGEDVVDHTCSMRCEHCDKRVWFDGGVLEVALSYQCPYCELDSYNKLYQDRRKRIDLLREEIARLKKALQEYADRDRWSSRTMANDGLLRCFASDDGEHGWKIAEEALGVRGGVQLEASKGNG